MGRDLSDSGGGWRDEGEVRFSVCQFWNDAGSDQFYGAHQVPMGEASDVQS